VCPKCGAATIVALTPSGRAIDLEFDHVFVMPHELFPPGIFILGASGGRNGPAVAHGVVDRAPNGRSGPFRREHVCVRAA
jgi:hypothetical protein